MMAKQQRTTEERARHWDSVYTRPQGASGPSWYQEAPRLSLELIDALGVGKDAAVIDVGAGTSVLVDHLLERGFVDLSVLDVSRAALDQARRRVGDAAPVEWLCQDLLEWQPECRFDLWHDRALFHFFVTPAARRAYLRTLHAALKTDGSVVLATFAPDGPEFCSGLPVARYSAGKLAQQIGADFEPIQTRREEHLTPTGVMQPYTWIAGRTRHPTGTSLVAAAASSARG
jgi:SAM-dependent methyltransferase